MKQLLLSLQRLYESRILEADHQVKHYAANSLAINSHSEVTKEASIGARHVGDGGV